MLRTRPVRRLPRRFPDGFQQGRQGWFGRAADLAGRVFKGVPAPTNLVIPPYKFVSDTKILIGEDELKKNA